MDANRKRLIATNIAATVTIVASYYAHKSHRLVVVGMAAAVGIRYYADATRPNQRTSKTDLLMYAVSSLVQHLLDLKSVTHFLRPGIGPKFWPLVWGSWRVWELYTITDNQECCVCCVGSIPRTLKQCWT